MIFNCEVQPAIIKGDVQGSMKKRIYNVEMSIDLKVQVISSSCSCPRGQVVCVSHHLAALLYYAYYNISSTDIQQRWGTTAAKLNVENSIQTIEQIYSPRQQCVVLPARNARINLEIC